MKNCEQTFCEQISNSWLPKQWANHPIVQTGRSTNLCSDASLSVTQLSHAVSQGKRCFLSLAENRWFGRKSPKILTVHSTHKTRGFAPQTPQMTKMASVTRQNDRLPKVSAWRTTVKQQRVMLHKLHLHYSIILWELFPCANWCSAATLMRH